MLSNATLRKKVQRLKDKVDTSQTKQNFSKIAAVSSTKKQNKSRGEQSEYDPKLQKKSLKTSFL